VIDEGVFRDESKRPLFSYAHPIFWAPFTLIGDARH
jgi:CHAT domain-containing protein